LQPGLARDVLAPLAGEPDLAVLLAQPVEVLPSRPRWHCTSLPSTRCLGESMVCSGERPALPLAPPTATNSCFKSYRLLHLEQICSNISPSSCSSHIDRRSREWAMKRRFIRLDGRGYQREAGVCHPTNNT